MTETLTCSMLIAAEPAAVFSSFVEPDRLAAFWLESATAPLTPGEVVEWRFKVPGAKETVTTTSLDRPHNLAFEWSEGVSVQIEISAHETGMTLTRITASGFQDTEAVVNATEGFAIVLSDLKLLLETGRSPGLVAAKAALITSTKAQM